MNTAAPTPPVPSARVAARLSEVQETLLIPLYFRALETERSDAIIRDPRAVEIVREIDFDFSRWHSAWNLQMDVAVRTEIFDQRVADFLERHPRGTVVNLGAGLDGRFLRLDNGTVQWWDLDLPDAMHLRQQFYQPGPRNHFLSSNCFDFDWLNRVEAAPSDPVLVVAEGLFCYCAEEDIQRLFAQLKQRWPGCEVIFQSICPGLVGREDLVAAIEETGARFRWGIHDGRQVCEWDRDYQFIGQWHLVDRHRRRWRTIRYQLWLPWRRRWFRQVMKITQLRLGSAQPAK